jgi:hypothetical protein
VRCLHPSAAICIALAIGCGDDAVVEATDAATSMEDAARSDGAPAPGSCVLDHEVTLPGHEGQFFGTPNVWCQTFVTGIPNAAFVVVGSDAAAVGDHDCTLARAVRYHVLWGDGSCEWTEWIERCDVRVSVEHAYDAPGEYVAAVLAEDREGRRTRSDDKMFTVVADGGDAFVTTAGGTLEGDTLRFDQTTGTYAMTEVDAVTVAYRLRDCDGVETELVELTLPAGTTAGQVILEVDPDRTLEQTCPESGSPPDVRGLNDLDRIFIAGCPGDLMP